jgi:hypothetical protein
VTARRDGQKLRCSGGDPLVADPVLLARSPAADNAAALAYCTRIAPTHRGGDGRS